MRIIGGKHRGRVLAEFKGKDIRPTADRVRESLFNILAPRLAGARVLDLFCGSGTLGLECISRGAREVVFNDSSRSSLEVLKKNLARIGERAEVLNLGYEVCLARVTGQFDLVFADPPYACDYLPDVGARLAARGLLAEGGLLVYESEHKGLPAPEGLIKTDERGYGRTYLAFFGRTV